MSGRGCPNPDRRQGRSDVGKCDWHGELELAIGNLATWKIKSTRQSNRSIMVHAVKRTGQ